MTPSGITGSIGVYMLHEDVSKMLDALGVKETFIYAGDYKTEGNPYEPLGEDAKAALQARVDESYDMFITDVAKGRGVSKKVVEDDFGQGRVYGAKESVDRKMADRIDTLQATLERFGVSMYSD